MTTATIDETTATLTLPADTAADALAAATAAVAGRPELQTVTGADPDAPALLPGPAAGAGDYWPAPEVEAIGAALIASCDELAHLRGATIRYLWRAKGPTKAGKDVLGVCQKPTGVLAHFAAADFLVVLSADHCHNRRLTNRQLEALIFHELSHADWDAEADKPGIRGHDWEGFSREVERYGAWAADLHEARTAFAQLGLEGIDR